MEEYVKNLSYTPNDVASVSSFTGLSNYQTFILSTATSISAIQWSFYTDPNCSTLANTITFNASGSGAVTLPAGGYRNLDAGSYQIANRYPGGAGGEVSGSIHSTQLTYIPASGSSVTGQCYSGSTTTNASIYSSSYCTGSSVFDLLFNQTSLFTACTITSCAFHCSYNPDTPF